MKKLMLSIIFCLIAVSAFAGPMDTRSLIEFKDIIATDTLATDTLSDAIYVNDYRACNIIIESGIATYTLSNSIKFQLLESDSENGTYTPVLAENIRGNNTTVDASGTFQLLKEEFTSVNVSETAYMGGAQFIKIKAKVNGSANGANKVFIIKTHPYLGF